METLNKKLLNAMLLIILILLISLLICEIHMPKINSEKTLNNEEIVTDDSLRIENDVDFDKFKKYPE